MRIAIVLLILGIWIGLLLGLSFIEAPLKFQAPGITTKLGIGIGHIIFGVLNKIELLFSVLIFILLGKQINSFSTVHFVLFAAVLVILLFQTIILLPALDQRVARLMADKPVEKTYHHLAFIFCEITKVTLLWATFLTTFSKFKKSIA